MTNEEVLQQFSDNPIPFIYAAVLILAAFAALIGLIVWITRRRDERVLRPRLQAWQIRPLDFFLFMTTLVLWFIMSSSLAFSLTDWASSFMEGDLKYAEMIAGIIAGIVMQLGMLVIFLAFRAKCSFVEEGSLSPVRYNSIEALGNGIFLFLAAYPCVLGVNAVWAVIVGMLAKLGFEIPLDPQPVVTFLLDEGDPLFFALVLLLAVVIAPVVEEFVFRAGIYRFMRGQMPLPLAVLVSSILFGIVHAHFLSFPGLTMVGVALALSYEYSGNLRVPIIFHAAFNLNSIILIQFFPQLVAPAG